MAVVETGSGYPPIAVRRYLKGVVLLFFILFLGCKGGGAENRYCPEDGGPRTCLAPEFDGTCRCPLGQYELGGGCTDPHPHPIDLKCDIQSEPAPDGLGSLYSYTVTLPPGTISFSSVLFHGREAHYLMAPHAVITPVGMESITDYYNEGSSGLWAGAPAMGTSVMQLPLTPRESALFDPNGGNYRIKHYVERFNPGTACHYTLSKTSPGTRLNIRLIPVGLQSFGLSAASAWSYSSVRTMVKRLRQIILSAGIQLGEVSFEDVGEAAQQDYAVLRSEEDIAELLSKVGLPFCGGDILSANVFLVRGIELEYGDTLGMSPGLPGPPAFHGSPLSGVVVEGLNLASSATVAAHQVAHGIAHELGHFLGLLHTSETDGVNHDLLLDTPECNDFQAVNIPNCPDLNNVMFPYDMGRLASFSPEQAWVLTRNPVVR